ncbi:MAG: multidrug ABC transporter permease [Proteobacteria bacterium]|nr:multidrug ABC transporter permease [Pseudomonadota bacterium]
MSASLSTPEPRIIKGINWIGLYTMTKKEVRRYMKVYFQTIVAPIVTTVLFYFVFSMALGGQGRGIEGVPYMTFLLPGLVMMGMAQNAFANTSSSLIIAKVQGSIVDVLMPPLSSGEILTAYTIGGVLRGLSVGFFNVLVMVPFAHLPVTHLWAIVLFSVLGCTMLSLLGVVVGIWAEKFDHLAGVTNFVVMPLTMLSGTFYAADHLPPMFEALAHANPFFYMIDGFRYGFIGTADMPLGTGIVMLIALSIALWMLALAMLNRGYKIRS